MKSPYQARRQVLRSAVGRHNWTDAGQAQVEHGEETAPEGGRIELTRGKSIQDALRPRVVKKMGLDARALINQEISRLRGNWPAWSIDQQTALAEEVG